MSRRTYDDYVANVKLRLGNRSDVTDERVSWWLTDALIRCANEYVQRQIETTTTSVVTTGQDYTVPAEIGTTMWWISQVKDVTNGRILKPGDRDEIENVPTKRTGAPNKYYCWGYYVYIDSLVAANTTLKLWFVAKPTSWTSGVHLLDEMFDPIVEMYAALQGFNVLRDFANAHLVEVECSNYIADMNLPSRKQRLDDFMSGIRVSKG